jgi:hypothetical protein
LARSLNIIANRFLGAFDYSIVSSNRIPRDRDAELGAKDSRINRFGMPIPAAKFRCLPFSQNLESSNP